MATTSKNKPSRLGRGLSSLMTTPVPVAVPPVSAPASPFVNPTTPPTPPTITTNPMMPPADTIIASPTPANDLPTSAEGLHHLSIDLIRPNPYQPRQHFDPAGLEQLAQSIRSDGLMQPIVVRPLNPPIDGKHYELVAGERRWRAARLALLTHVPTLVRSLTDQQSAEFALIENLQREDLNAMERAHAFAQLADQFRLSHEQIAERVGVDRSTVTNLLRLLDLDPVVQGLVEHNVLSAGQARALVSIVHPDQQKLLAERAVRGDWSVRQVEAAVRSLMQGATLEQAAEPTRQQTKAAHLDDLAQRIGQQLGTKVYLRAGRKKGTGSITLEFYTLDQFDDLMQRLGVKTE